MTSPLLWIWLAEACRPGTDTWGRLCRAGLSPKWLYEADRGVLAPFLGRRRAALDALCSKDLTEAGRILEACTAADITVVPYDAPEYPDAFRRLLSPPAVLYVRGRADLSSLPLSVSIVGTRDVSAYGERMAFAYADALARAGVAVISGLALGVDAVAHAGTLCAGGVTVAVIASGVDNVYPACHRYLADEICAHGGAIASEYPPGSRPERYRFPERNRLVAALGTAVAVIEGSAASGALITARSAMEQGIPVYALPGRAGDRNAEAAFALFREGAKMLLSPEDLLADFPSAPRGPIPPSPAPEVAPEDGIRRYGVCTASSRVASPAGTPSAQKAEGTEKIPSASSDESEKRSLPTADLGTLSPAAVSLLYAIPEDGSCLPDELSAQADPATLIRLLTVLELAGTIRRMPSGRICRIVALP